MYRDICDRKGLKPALLFNVLQFIFMENARESHTQKLHHYIHGCVRCVDGSIVDTYFPIGQLWSQY